MKIEGNQDKTGKYLLIKLLKEIKITDKNKKILSSIMHESKYSGGSIFEFTNHDSEKWAEDNPYPPKKGLPKCENYNLIDSDNDLQEIFKDIKSVKVFAKMIERSIIIELRAK